MKVETLVLGGLQTNCYIVYHEETKRGFIVDPADEAGKIRAMLDRLEIVPEAILLTHGHFDHILAAAELRTGYGIPIYVHEKEKGLLESAGDNLSGEWASAMTLTPDVTVKEGEELSLAGCRIRVLHTPGHTPGSVCYYIEEAHILLAGDTLFYNSFGRYDLPGGSLSSLLKSLKRLLCLPEETAVYPGHGEETSIGYERQYNPAAGMAGRR